MSVRAVVLVLVGLGAAAPMAPQQGDQSGGALASAFSEISRDLLGAAEKMPPESYAFRPADGVRTFGQIIAHVGGGNFLYCSQASKQRLASALSSRLNEVRPFSDVLTAANARVFKKEELVALLSESIAFCERVYNDRGVSAGDGVRALIGNIAHDNEHYGNLVTYLRMKGLVPPSTDRRKGGQ
jgi:uncharacterized damage-inducible protein DinB